MVKGFQEEAPKPGWRGFLLRGNHRSAPVDRSANRLSYCIYEYIA